MALSRQRFMLGIWTLPRHFAVPVAIASVVLGWVVSAPLTWQIIFPVLAIFGISAYSHTMNTWLDYVWTGLDKGVEEERSHPKPYTGGQQVLAAGLMTTNQVAIVAILWAMFGGFFAGAAGTVTALVAFGALAITFWYSWGKLHWQCETALAVGFGPMPAVIGAAASGSPDYGTAILASLPIAIIFGFAAEIFDQWWDADANWTRGLRNIGALVWKTDGNVTVVVVATVAVTYALQAFLVSFDVLAVATLYWTAPSLLSLLAADEARKRKPWAVMTLLGGVFLYCALLVLGQALD